ncbi:MaoC/PaaZ C-terminal domain-containing protein [Rhodospirillum sp. A1_3_36]|uniref:MaoC/PaaZ C-terminal domain-containing protein n=1 Tax=Rhodospirillum sp. A1_3_36 TaxID=3391666 RepID=UPI0039A6E218
MSGPPALSTAPPLLWRETSQADADAFRDLTGDDQWIHVDPDRAAREGVPGGGTVLPGAFLLSVLVAELGRALGYPPGTRSWQRSYETVRFLRPAPVGGRLGATAREVARRTARPGRCLVVVDAVLHCDRVPEGPVLTGRFTSLLEETP